MDETIIGWLSQPIIKPIEITIAEYVVIDFTVSSLSCNGAFNVQLKYYRPRYTYHYSRLTLKYFGGDFNGKNVSCLTNLSD